MDFPHLGYGNPKDLCPQHPCPQRGTGQSIWGQSPVREVRVGSGGGNRASIKGKALDFLLEEGPKGMREENCIQSCIAEVGVCL